MGTIKTIYIHERIRRKPISTPVVLVDMSGVGLVSAEEVSRLFKKVHINERGCWIRGNDGGHYTTVVRDDGTKIKAHRLSYEAFHGKKISINRNGCHKCNTPACINPEHVFSGTQSENMQDARSKKRGFEGSSCKPYRNYLDNTEHPTVNHYTVGKGKDRYFGHNIFRKDIKQ